MSDELHWQTAKEYKSEIAAELADLASILRDLNFTIRASELVLEITPNPPSSGGEGEYLGDEGIRRTSLWNSAIVAYARCFASGVRKVRLNVEMFDSLGDKAEDAKKAHIYFIELRNKYVAHSVNRFEDARVALLVGDGIHSKKGVIGGGPFLIWPAAENRGNVQNLVFLAGFLKNEMELMASKHTERVIEEAQKLTDKELQALPDMAIPIPVQPDEVGKRRH